MQLQLGSKARNMKALFIFVLITVGGGAAIGTVTAPGVWYAELIKPSFNPPSWLFGPVWSILYLLVAIAGWRLWKFNRFGWAMRFWWIQLLLNFIWSPIFFNAQRIDFAFIVITMLFATIIALIVTIWRSNRLVAFLSIPYAAWVGFASVLNFSILILN